VLKHRLVSGTLLIAVLAVVVFVDHWVADLLFLALSGFVVWAALHEYSALTRIMGWPGFPRLTVVASLALIVAELPVCRRHLTAVPAEELVTVALLLASFCLVFRAADLRQGMRDLMATLAGFFYLGWPLSFLVRIYYYGEPPVNGTFLLFFVVLVTKCGDIGGYALGCSTARRPQGNHKLVPRLSPKKSWEGLVGSLLFSGVAGGLIPWLMPTLLTVDGQTVLTPVGGAAIGVVLALVGLIGDLAESVLKRAADVKDSGATLPGMGGVLDVIDSLVFAGPLFYCYLRLAT
jgi:phosphatidate cytidylyltransferase